MSSDKLEDRDLQPTEHTSHFHAYWLRYKNGTILAAPEQMRYATEDEILACMELPDSLRGLDSKIPERDYLDIRSECPVQEYDVVHTTRVNPVADVNIAPPGYYPIRKADGTLLSYKDADNLPIRDSGPWVPPPGYR